MFNFKKVIALALVLGVICFALVGCKSKSDHPTAEQPTVEQPAAEHPTAEHPTAEHPTAEHPK